jgi:signal transduction histidine kinase
MKVLIVDDSPTNLKVLRAVLEGEKLEVIEAPDGAQALALLQHESADAIISDILMPHMDGYRLCHEVRKSERWREMPFIFHTATYTSPGDEKLCYDLGGDKYLRKPASVKALLSALGEVTNISRKRPAHRASAPPESDIMKEYSERLVSKLEQKNEELEQARAELQQANRELDSRVQQRTAELTVANQELESFSHSVSHDLRAPLRHIGGYIDILRRDCASQLDEANLKHLQTVQTAARTMSKLIDALLELSKVTRSPIHRCSVDLSALAATVFAELQQGDPNRVVKLEIMPGLKANGDELLLHVVLVNLLGNAWKYTRKQPDTRIEFGKIAGEAVDTYFVRDNGDGFDMAYVGKLFKAFQRLHRADDFEGTGIGLATVQRIIHRHNGKIWAESIGHQGAIFYFTLEGEPARQGPFISN